MSSPEILAPFGDITFRIRFAWDCHPGQFPSSVLSFLGRLLLLVVICLSYFVQAPPMGFKEQDVVCGTELAPRIPEKIHPKRQPSSGYANRRAHRKPKSSATDLLQIHIPLSSNKLNSTSLATVDASLTWLIASNQPGRRAHQQPNRRNPIRR